MLLYPVIATAGSLAWKISDLVVSERCQKRRHEIAGLFLDKNFGPLIGPAQHQPGIDAVDRRLFDTLDMGVKRGLVPGFIDIADNHSEDFLDGNLPGRIDRLKFIGLIGHRIFLLLQRQPAELHRHQVQKKARQSAWPRLVILLSTVPVHPWSKESGYRLYGLQVASRHLARLVVAL
jgi:hypothetical protein